MAIATVRRHNGVPTLFINDQPHAPYVYFFPYPAKERIADFAQAGIHIYSWGWGHYVTAHSMDMGWVGPDTYEYGKFDREVATILEADPQAWLFPRIGVSAPGWWLESHPADRIVCEDGTDYFWHKRYLTSLASKTWLEDASVAFEHLIRHVRSMPYGERFIGYQVTGGVNEWFYTFTSTPIDFSLASVAAFRLWLRKKYNNDAVALRRAWKQDVDFENAGIPGEAERLRTDANLIRDPSVSAWVSDYYWFFSEIDAEALVRFCKVGKSATRNENVFGAYYGYILQAASGFSGGYSSCNWGQQALRKVLGSLDVDFICAPYQYYNRGPGGYDGEQGLPESVKLSGKLWFTECDHPTFMATPAHHQLQGRGIPTRAQTFGLMKRDFSRRFTTRVGMWWMDLIPDGAWYHHPDIVRFLKRTVRLLDKSSRLPIAYKGEVAVFVDEETPSYLKPGVELLYPLVYMQERLGLSRMGTPFDVYLHNDLANPEMPDYKLYIFLDTLYLTDEERRSIKEKVHRSGKTAVWMYAPGFISDGGLSVENVSDLTGMDIRCAMPAPSFGHNYRQGGCPIHVYLTDFAHPITDGASAGTVFGTNDPIGPIFYCDDPKARTLGRLLPPMALEGQILESPGLAVREFADWKSIFVAVPNVPSSLLRNIARYAGCHVYGDSDEVLYANSHFVAIHASKGGLKTVRLPRRTDVYDAFTEQHIAQGVTEFTDDVPQHATRLYFLGDISQIADEETRLDRAWEAGDSPGAG